ncbi:MAG: hypothetical protein KOO60_01970 [Gemmatimonadales bacterium]|nr:hypothetical protein [Gemmatimonadales bacterium]
MLFQLNGRRMLGLVFACLLFFSCWVGSVPGGELTESALCSWDKPTYGTPVHHYVLELEEIHPDGVVEVMKFGGIIEESIRVDLLFGNTYRARVAGVDAEDRQGPWSLWTPVYAPEATAADHFSE